MSRIIKFINARLNTKTDTRISSGMEDVKEKKRKEKMVCKNVKPELVQVQSPFNNNNNNTERYPM